jgi:hypothetical protein
VHFSKSSGMVTPVHLHGATAISQSLSAKCDEM